MALQANEKLTPVGRIVQGSLWEPNTKDFHGKDLTDTKGNPRVEYYVGLAIEKTNPDFDPFWQFVTAQAQSYWPNLAQIQGFAWKCMDGDDQKYAERKDFHGNWVLKLTSGFEFKVYDRDGTTILTSEAVKRGDYVRAVVSVNTNGNSAYPGIFLNIRAFQFQGYGAEIVGGADFGAAFSAPAGATPTGMSATPVGGNVGPGGMATPPVSGPPVSGPLGMATPPVSSPGAPPPPPAPGFHTPTGPKMTPKAAGFSYEQMIEKGWTHELLVSEGYVE